MPSDLKSRYTKFIELNQLKSSKRRDLIFEQITQQSGHFTANHIYQQLVQIDAGIGIATIYRTLRLLVTCGVLLEHTFGEKKGFFEVNDTQCKQHDHVICTSCGKIIEFYDDLIENEKQRIAEQYQFRIQAYKLEIYGLCKECQS